MQTRVREQIDYYRRTADTQARALARLRWGILLVGTLAVTAGALSPTFPWIGLLVSLLTTVSAALVALSQSARLEALIPLYRDTARDLELLVAKWEDALGTLAAPAERRQKDILLVVACEEAMSRENSSWRSTWLDPAQLQASHDALTKARAQAEGAAPGKPAVTG